VGDEVADGMGKWKVLAGYVASIITSVHRTRLCPRFMPS